MIIVIPGAYNAQTFVPGGNVQGQTITVGAILKVTERDRRPYPSDPGVPSEIWIDNTAAIGYICKENGPTGTVWDRLDLLGDYIAFGDNDPGPNADITWGFRPGSLRYARNTQTLWICDNNTQGAAIWSVLGAGALTLQTNGLPNGDQTLLNIVAGTNMTITDDGAGNITFDSLGGGGLIGSTSGVVNSPTPGATFETYLGEGAGSGTTPKNSGVIIGRNAGVNMVQGSGIIIGPSAGDNSTESGSAIMMGFEAGKNSRGFSSIVIGPRAALGMTELNYGLVVGGEAGRNSDKLASFVVLLGIYAGRFISGGDVGTISLIAIGYRAGEAALNANRAVFLGQTAGINCTNAVGCVFIGHGAGSGSTVDCRTEGFAIAIGQGAKPSSFNYTIALGLDVVNTKEKQFYVHDEVFNYRLRGLDYELPSTQAAGVLTNDGSGILTWADGGGPPTTGDSISPFLLMGG
jgi:hypothetical protein